MESFIARHGLKLIIFVKAIVLGYIVIEEFGWVDIGEKTSIAQDQAKNQPETEKASEKQASSEDEEVVVKRKSFLDDLLNLPSIQTDGLQKEEISRYLDLVEKKRRQVEDRIKLLSSREDQLRNLEKTIESKIRKLEEEMAFFKQTQQKEKEIKKERLTNLIEFYKKMKPKQAAPVFEKMDRDLVVALFNEIPQKQTMNILAAMEPDKSVELSEYYGRIRSAKEYELLKEINVALSKEFEECKGMPKQDP